MTIIHPLFLIALGALAVPILLHFLMRQKPRKFVFPALRFLQKKEGEQKRHLQLRHWLLLVVRLAILTVVVFLFARPNVRYSSSAVRGDAPTAAIFLVDTSLRMDYRFENQTHLEAAKKQILAQLATLPADSTAAIVTTQPGPCGFLPDVSEAQRRVQNLELSAHTQSLTDALLDALPLFEKVTQPRRVVYILSDLTERAWTTENPERLRQSLSRYKDVSFLIADVGTNAAMNCVLDIPTEQTFQPSGGLLRLKATFQLNDVDSAAPGGTDVSGPSDQAEAGEVTRIVSLFMLDENGEPQKRTEQSVTVRPNEIVPLEFLVGGLHEGVNQGFLELEGGEVGDALACDNRRYFTVQLGDSTEVLVVGQEPVEKTTAFVVQALAPAQFQKEHKARFTCQTATYPQLVNWLANRDGPGNPLAEVSALFLLDPPPLESRTWSQLLAEVNVGLGVAIFPGAASSPVSAFNTAEAQNVLPAPLDMQARQPQGVFLQPKTGQSHPILQAFQDLHVSIPWDAFPVFRYWQLGKPQKGVQTVFVYSNGEPALLERTYGAGRVLTMTTPPLPVESNGKPWNLLPQRDAWVFVVMMNAMANYLSGTGEIVRNAHLTQGLTFPVDTGETTTAAEEKYVLQKVEVKAAEKIPLTADKRLRRLDVPQLETAGNYQVAGRTGDVQHGFSVNVPLTASDLTRVTPEELTALFAPLPVRVVRDLAELDVQRNGGQVGVELFPFLAVCLLVLLLMENWLAGRFYRKT